MPRTNIPFRSPRYFSNKKRSSSRSSDSQQGSSCPVNNILVFPKNSETTINVLGNNSQSLPYDNLLKKIKGRKRKEKQRLKKKLNLEDDVKPLINTVKDLRNEKMKPRINKHIIFLSDSDNESSEIDNLENTTDNSVFNDTFEKNDKNDMDDDVIFVETPAAEIIEIEDSIEQTETSERISDSSNILEKNNELNSPDVNDFLDKEHINLNSKFNFELHGSEFKGAEFLKPSTVLKDMSESGSVSSVSDVSATIGMNVFNVVDFPQEKVNLFDDTNLEKFRNAITPKRLKNVSKTKEFNDSRCREKHNDSLPTLSDIQIENNSRKERGRSIIKELVNDRAYELLSTDKKKLKNKKRKSKDALSDTLDQENENDNHELSKKKKKKKYKKRDNSPNEIDHGQSKSPSSIDIVEDGKNKKRKERTDESEDEAVKYIAIRNDLFESNASEVMNPIKKSKKNRNLDLDASIDEEDVEKRKKKMRKNEKGVAEDNEEKRKKKNKRTGELSVEQQCMEASIVQERSEEKKKKKTKGNLEVVTDTTTEKNDIELQHNVLQTSEDNQEKKKKKGRRISEASGDIYLENNKSDILYKNIDNQENSEEKRKKKNHKALSASADIINLDNPYLEEVQEEKNEIMKLNEKEELELAKNKTDQQRDIENNEEKKRRKARKGLEVYKQIDSIDNENVTYSVKSRIMDQNENGNEKCEIIQEEGTKTTTEDLGMEVEKSQEKGKDVQFPSESITIDKEHHETEDIEGDSDKLKKVIIILPHAISSGAHQNNYIDVQKNNEGKTSINIKRTSEASENIIEKQKLEEHNLETVDIADNVENRKISEGIEETSTEINTNKTAVEKEVIERHTIEQTVGNVEYDERLCDTSVENTADSLKKRKQSSLSEIINDSLESLGVKRMKIDNSQPQIAKCIVNDKGLFGNVKETKKEYIDEVSNKKNERIIVTVEETGNKDNHVSSVHRSIGNTRIEEIVTDPRIIENAEYYNQDVAENSKLNKSVDAVINNEGNINMQITNAFTLNKLIFSEETTFVDDVNLDNFSDKNNSSWSADPSRFQSYNGSLFNDVNRETLSEISNQIPNIESISAVTSSTVLEPISNQTLALEVITPNLSSLHNPKETIVVKNEDQNANDTLPSEKRDNLQHIQVKMEVESEEIAKISVEENTSEQMSLEKKIASESILEMPNEPSEIFNQELPNEIEEIVKEKDNRNTVMRLCEFLEEARDPNDVLKKVLLLKQASTDKSQNSVNLQEEVQITYDNDDVFSVSSGDSSIVLLEDDVSIVSIDDDITLANCDLADGEKGTKIQNETVSRLLSSSSDSNKSINSEVNQNEKIENVASTSQPISNSFFKPSEQLKKGLDKYEIEDIQGHMSSDPKLWKIVSEDICPIRLPTKGKRCIKCREMGHLGHNCPNKLNLPKCSLCGMEGHLDFRCPNKLCTQCGRKAPNMLNCCDHCKHYRNLTCALCKNKGHPKSKCPDLWRRYHLTVNQGPLVQRDILGLKSKDNLWCSSCAKSGHVEFQCGINETLRLFRNFKKIDPRIHNYDDVYNKSKPENTVNSIRCNSDEVPHTSRISLNNDNTSGASSSITSKINIENPSQSTSNLPSKKTAKQDHSTQNTEERPQCSSKKSKDIKKVNEENKNIALDESENGYRKFFLTASTESLKKLLHQELSNLKNNKFKLQDLIPRFIAFSQGTELPDQRKKKFYKQLNMLLFGKLQIKGGNVHLAILQNFMNNTPRALSTEMRQSLWGHYNCIFRNKLHKNMNYMYFLKSLKEKYGNLKWLQ